VYGNLYQGNHPAFAVTGVHASLLYQSPCLVTGGAALRRLFMELPGADTFDVIDALLLDNPG
jgi:hypothetical protein